MRLRVRVVHVLVVELHAAVMPVMIVNVRGGGQVDRAERQEDERLQRSDDQSQELNRQRRDERHDAGDDQHHQVLAEDVAEQTQRQRQHAREVADDFDDEDHRRQRDRHARHHREVLDVGDRAVRHDALHVIVEPQRQRERERDVDVAGRRAEAGNLAHQVAEQDEDEDGAEQRQELAALRAHVAFEHADQERHDVLEDDLQLAGVVDAQLRADGQADEQDEQRDQPDEDHVIGHVDPQRREEQVDQRNEWGGMFNSFHSRTLYYFSQGPGTSERRRLKPSPSSEISLLFRDT